MVHIHVLNPVLITVGSDESLREQLVVLNLRYAAVAGPEVVVRARALGTSIVHHDRVWAGHALPDGGQRWSLVLVCRALLAFNDPAVARVCDWEA